MCYDDLMGQLTYWLPEMAIQPNLEEALPCCPAGSWNSQPVKLPVQLHIDRNDTEAVYVYRSGELDP